MLNLWGFLFSNFHHKDHIGANRTTFWELVHFPLHFGMLLLLASLVVRFALCFGIADHCRTSSSPTRLTAASYP